MKEGWRDAYELSVIFFLSMPVVSLRDVLELVRSSEGSP